MATSVFESNVTLTNTLCLRWQLGITFNRFLISSGYSSLQDKCDSVECFATENLKEE